MNSSEIESMKAENSRLRIMHGEHVNEVAKNNTLIAMQAHEIADLKIQILDLKSKVSSMQSFAKIKDNPPINADWRTVSGVNSGVVPGVSNDPPTERIIRDRPGLEQEDVK